MSNRKPREKAFTQQQMKQISHNVNILIEKSGMTYEQLCECSQLSENTIKSIRIYENSLSVNIPSKRTISKLAVALSTYYSYENITLKTLIEKDFATINFFENRTLRQKLEWYEGIYYAYSISIKRADKEKCLQYSIVKIYIKNNQLRCSWFLDKNEQFHIRAEQYLNADYSFDNILEKLKRDFHKDNRTVPYYDYDGEVVFSGNSITINLISNQNIHTRCITFMDSYDVLKNRFYHFEGVTGVMLASTHADYPAIAQLVTISSQRKSDEEVKKILKENFQNFSGGFLYFL